MCRVLAWPLLVVSPWPLCTVVHRAGPGSLAEPNLALTPGQRGGLAPASGLPVSARLGRPLAAKASALTHTPGRLGPHRDARDPSEEPAVSLALVPARPDRPRAVGWIFAIQVCSRRSLGRR